VNALKITCTGLELPIARQIFSGLLLSVIVGEFLGVLRVDENGQKEIQ
jgi:hypothetical protein